VNIGEKLPEPDRAAYETLAKRGAAITGYRALSYLDLRSGTDKEGYRPSAFGWLYNRRGIFSFITEFWNPLKVAGINLENTLESTWLWGYHPVEDELKLLRWSDKELGGDGFVAWKPFKHPQLGDVEIGGFDLIRYWYNIPFDRLEKEVAPHSEWLVQLGLSTARLSVRSFSAESIGDELWRVRLVVENTGWLPTNGSQQSLDQKIIDGVRAELALPAGAKLVEGDASQATRPARGTHSPAIDGELVGIYARHTGSRIRRLDSRGTRRQFNHRQGEPGSRRERPCRRGIGRKGQVTSEQLHE
jgi:hypothetical protein